MPVSSVILSDLSKHLKLVDEDPTVQLDAELLEKCEFLTATAEYQDHIWKATPPLFQQISNLLPQLQQDPSPLTDFVIKLAGPYRFEDIKDIEFEIGLDLQATPFHNLILVLLSKAATSSTDAQVLANRPVIVSSIVRLWLCTQDAGIATQAENLLTSLLRVSKNEPVAMDTASPLHMYGNGPMWRRLFSDRDINSLYYHFTSIKQLSSSSQPLLNKRDKTIAQARLLSWLPIIGAMDWSTIVSSHNSEVEKEIGITEKQGLLHYTALNMVRIEDDLLMHMTLINFFGSLITTVTSNLQLVHYNSSLSLDFLKQEGIHKRLIDFHTSDNPDVNYSFLSPGTAQYISNYASNYPENFEKSLEMQAIRDYVHRNIKKCEASNLNIIASMPRSSLIPRKASGLAWNDCLILDMPITRTNQDALKTLAIIFHGPPKEITFPQVEKMSPNPQHAKVEAVFARLLTALFFSKKPSMFSDIVRHMETIAMKDNAIAALSLIQALITASWSTELLPELIPGNDTTYSRLNRFPQTGLELILDSSLSGGVLPSLLKPATTFSTLVGGRGEAENAAYQVAMAKFDLVKTLGRKLEEDGRHEDLTAMVRRRVLEGPWGSDGNAGSRIGTLEL